MNIEQQEYINSIDCAFENGIFIKRTGWEEIKLPKHSHDKYQIVYTLSGTLHIQIGATSYFVPERHIAWIPCKTGHELSSNNSQVSLIIFYTTMNILDENDMRRRFSIYNTNSVIAENLKFIILKGDKITETEQPDIYNFIISFFKLLPSMGAATDFMLKTLVIPNDMRLRPILDYMVGHLQENLEIEQIAKKYGMSVRNLSRLFNDSGIHFSSYINNQRIMRAIELFADGGKTMQEIAYEVGFNTPNNFNRVFKQIIGMSPGAFLTNNVR